MTLHANRNTSLAHHKSKLYRRPELIRSSYLNQVFDGILNQVFDGIDSIDAAFETFQSLNNVCRRLMMHNELV